MKLFNRDRTSADKTLGEARSLEESGRGLEAVELLANANREKPDPRIEDALVRARNHAFDSLGDPGSDFVEPAATVPPADGEADGIPTVAAADLTAAAVRSAMLSHGCLLVRGLLSGGEAEGLRGDIDRVFDARDAHADGADRSETEPWFAPFEPDGRYAGAVNLGRSFVGQGSGIWTADSPRVLFKLLDAYERAGIKDTVGEYLGERPAISVNKGTLRRAAPKVGTEWWHQDGAFLGEGIRSLNIWVALNPCGVDSPGMEIVSKRLEEIAECGTRGADFDWSVSDEVVAEVAGQEISWPVFEAGDALLFDHLCLHRTGTKASMTETRYAIETWFFAPSAYPNPQNQVPLAF